MTDRIATEPHPEDEDADDFPIPVDAKGNPKKPAKQKRLPRRGSDPLCPKIGRARVQRIALLRASGQWNYQIQFALALEWGLSIKTVEHYANRAGELLDLVATTSQELEKEMVGTLRLIISETMVKGKHREATEAIKVLAGLKGLDKTHQAAQAATNVFVGVDELMAARVRAAAEANAAPETADAERDDAASDGGG